MGLILMRSVVGSALIVRASSTLRSDPAITTTITAALLLGSGILLIPGLWTPIVGTLVALIEACQIRTSIADLWVPLLLATICGALAMLGPGLWSVDARLFGWRRVEAPPRKSSSNSP
jgi:hypothetical protein